MYGADVESGAAYRALFVGTQGSFCGCTELI